MHAALNGTLADDGELGIAPGDRGLTLGDGLFETIAVRAGRPRRLDAHLARLRAGLAALGFTAEPELARPVHDVIAANGLETGTIRLTVTRGPAGRGVVPPEAETPTVLVTAGTGAPPETSVAAVISERVRRNEHSPGSALKSLSYLDTVLARQDAAARGAADAIVLNTAGNVAEATVANLAAVIDGRAVTPPVTGGALPGVVRAEAVAAGELAEATLTPAMLRRADEIVLINALGVRPVTQLDGQPVGSGTRGELAALMRARLTAE